jgi:hypothetical protein
MKLYELPLGFLQWEAKVVEAGEEVTEELAAEFELLRATLAEKSDAIVWLVRGAEADAAGYRAMAREFAGKAQAAEHRVDSLKAYLTRVLRAMKLDGVNGRCFTVSRSRAGRPRIRWDHAAPIPEGFARVDISLDGEKAHEAYRSGTLPEGFEVVHAEILRIR